MSASDRWCLVGDSIMAAVFENDPTVGNAANLTANKIPTLKNYVSINNFSVPGAKLCNDFEFRADTILHGAGFFGYQNGGVIIQLGQNDWGDSTKTVADFKISLQKLILDLLKGGITKIVVCAPIWCVSAATAKPMPGGTKVLADYRDACSQVVTALGDTRVKYINAYAFTTNSAYFVSDGIHMNGTGHTNYASFLLTQMQALGYWT